jgi:hypothetical protein
MKIWEKKVMPPLKIPIYFRCFLRYPRGGLPKGEWNCESNIPQSFQGILT